MRTLGKFVVVIGIAVIAIAGAPRGASAQSWQGAYIGVHLGANFFDGRMAGSLNAFDNASATAYDLDFSGLAGGVVAGYNWQRGGLVYGIEADASLGHKRFQKTARLGAGTFDDVFSVNVGPIASLGGRLGWALGSWMPYVKGGVVAAKLDIHAGDTDGLMIDVGDETRKSGWSKGVMIGGGLEWMFTERWTTRFEYLYIDFRAFESGNLDGDIFKHDLANHALKVGLSYRF